MKGNSKNVAYKNCTCMQEDHFSDAASSLDHFSCLSKNPRIQISASKPPYLQKTSTSICPPQYSAHATDYIS